MRGTYYKTKKTVAVINIVGLVDGDIPFNNKEDLTIQFDKDRGILVMKESKRVKL